MIDLSIPGQMSEGELRAIEQLAQKAPKQGCVVEVGSLYGLSSFTWATSVDPSVTVHCIDPWVPEPWIIALVKSNPGCPEFGFNAFRTFTASCRNIVPHKGYSPQDFKNWDRPVDIFFDDAVHHNPFIRESLRFWLTKMRPGGIMCGHDYCKEWPDVIVEVNRLASELGVAVHRQQWLWWIELPHKRD